MDFQALRQYIYLVLLVHQYLEDLNHFCYDIPYSFLPSELPFHHQWPLHFHPRNNEHHNEHPKPTISISLQYNL